MKNLSRDYYISATGDDRAQGTESAPWGTLARLKNVRLSPGDRVCLDSRANHHGCLVICNQFGTSENPSIFTGYGSERPAVIVAGDGIGMLLQNCSGIKVSNFHLLGGGYPQNQTHGLFHDSQSTESHIAPLCLVQH